MQFVTLNRLTTAVKFHIVTHVYGPTSANFSLPRPLCSRLRPDVCDRQTSDRQTSDAHHDANPNLCLYVSDKLTVSPSSLNAPTGTLKTREWKTGYHEKYGGWKTRVQIFRVRKGTCWCSISWFCRCSQPLNLYKRKCRCYRELKRCVHKLSNHLSRKKWI